MGPRILSTPFHKYGNVCWECDGTQIEARRRGDAETLRGGATKIWACPAPTLRADCGRSLCLSSSPMSLHRLLLSSRPRFASPIRKRYRIYEREYEGTVKTGIQVIRGCSDPIQRAGILHRLSSRSGVGASRWLATSGSPRVARRDRQDCKDLRNVGGACARHLRCRPARR